MATTESAWDDEQYKMMADFTAYEASIHSCGHPLSESTSPLADADNPLRQFEYKAQLPIRCHACTAINKMQVQYQGENFDNARIFMADKVDVRR